MTKDEIVDGLHFLLFAGVDARLIAMLIDYDMGWTEEKSIKALNWMLDAGQSGLLSNPPDHRETVILIRETFDSTLETAIKIEAGERPKDPAKGHYANAGPLKIWVWDAPEWD